MGPTVAAAVSRAALLAWVSLLSAVGGTGTAHGETAAWHYDAFLVAPVLKGAPARSDRKPVLIYYAVDTAEPFMQWSVDFEIRQLIAACTTDTDVNWIAIVNSWVVNDRTLLACRDGEMAELEPPYDSLKRTMGYIADPDFNPRLHPEALRFPVRVTEANRPYQRFFGVYPLTHPDIFHDLLLFVGTSVFPAAQFDYFLHTKAHGSQGLVMTAPDDEGLAERVADQARLLRQALAERGIHETPVIRPGDVGRQSGPFPLPDIGLGAVANAPDLDAGEVPPLQGGLGVMNLSVVDNPTLVTYFGMDVLGLDRASRAVARRLLSGDGEVRRHLTDFLFVEACDSNITSNRQFQDILDASRASHGAFYSAAGMLWFRNLNWDVLLTGPERLTTEGLQARLLSETARVRNFRVTPIP